CEVSQLYAECALKRSRKTAVIIFCFEAAMVVVLPLGPVAARTPREPLTGIHHAARWYIQRKAHAAAAGLRQGAKCRDVRRRCSEAPDSSRGWRPMPCR